MELTAKESGLTYSLVAGVQKLRLSGAENRAFAQWAKSYTPIAQRTYDPPAFLRLSGVFLSGISLIGTVVIYYFSITTKVSLANYFAFNSAYATVMENGFGSSYLSIRRSQSFRNSSVVSSISSGMLPPLSLGRVLHPLPACRKSRCKRSRKHDC